VAICRQSGGSTEIQAPQTVSKHMTMELMKMKTITSAIISAALLAFAGLASAADGQAIYQQSCQSCHAAGIAGAPKLGDKEAWAPRIATGMDAIMASVMNGKNAMPPKGACMSCSDDDLKAAAQYMVDQAK
jgi:cytochrome c5